MANLNIFSSFSALVAAFFFEGPRKKIVIFTFLPFMTPCVYDSFSVYSLSSLYSFFLAKKGFYV